MSKPKDKLTANSMTVEIRARPEEKARKLAQTSLQPSLNNSLLVATYTNMDETPSIMELTQELSQQCELASTGNMGRPEAMLLAQAHSLDAIYTKLAWMARKNITSNFDVFDRLLRLALKAQSQCRATLETLATVKNPPVVIARQANVTSGPQQVNNGIPLARENTIEPNKLLEQSNGQRLDRGAASQASGSDQEMATVGAIDGTKVGRR